MRRHSVVDGENQCLQGQVYIAWVRPRDLTTGKFERSQSQVGENFITHHLKHSLDQLLSLACILENIYTCSCKMC